MVSFPSAHKTGKIGAAKEGDFGDDGDEDSEDSEDEVVGGNIESCVDNAHILDDEQVTAEFSSPFPNPTFQQLPTAQMEWPSNATNANGMYDTSYNASQQFMPFDGLFQGHQSFANNTYNNASAFQTTDGMYEDNGIFNNAATEQTSIDINNQRTGSFPDINGGYYGVSINGGGVDTDSLGNGGIPNGLFQQDGLAYQMGNGYGTSSNAFNANIGGLPISDTSGNNVGSLPLINGHNHTQPVPHPIQTSWPTNDSTAWVSNDTSVNQTPAGPSGGADFGTGYFANDHFEPSFFEDANMDNFSGNDGSDMLFNTGSYAGDFVDGSLYSNGTYGA